MWAVTVQNEPHYSPATYPGMLLPAAQEAEFVGRHLGPTFAAAGIDAILAFDGNWDGTAHALDALADPVARGFISGTAFHCYAGDPARQDDVHDAHPDRAIYGRAFSYLVDTFRWDRLGLTSRRRPPAWPG